jgi:hypothetical protein
VARRQAEEHDVARHVGGEDPAELVEAHRVDGPCGEGERGQATKVHGSLRGEARCTPNWEIRVTDLVASVDQP